MCEAGLLCSIDLSEDAVLDVILAVDVDEVAGTDESVPSTIALVFDAVMNSYVRVADVPGG